MMPVLLSLQVEAGSGNRKTAPLHTDKNENQIFLIYKEVQNGSVAKSHMRKGFVMYEEMRKYLVLYCTY